MKYKKVLFLLALPLLGIIAYNVCDYLLQDIGHCDAPSLPLSEQLAEQGADAVIYVDFSKASGVNRMMVVDLKTDKTLLACPVLQGRGKGFSNEVGSLCSSLGLYRLTKTDHLRNGYPCIRLEGLETTNSNAALRGIVIHPSVMVMPFQIPLFNYPRTKSSEGCFAVNYFDYKRIEQIFQNKNKIYLYAYVNS